MNDLILAQQLADIADQVSLARFRASDLVIDSKPDLTPVSDADKKIEQLIREHLLKVSTLTLAGIPAAIYCWG